MAIAPPTIIATIGTSRPPKLVTASTNLIRRLLAPSGAEAQNEGAADAALKGRSSTLIGGADRDRTGGLLVANQALSQLSYSPNPSGQWSVSSGQKNPLATDFLVGLDRLELSTSPLSGVRSSHLSYRPGLIPA